MLKINLVLLLVFLCTGCTSVSREQREQLDRLEKFAETQEKKEEEAKREKEESRKEQERNTAKKVETLKEKWTDETGVELEKTTTTESTLETSTATASTTTTGDTTRSSQARNTNQRDTSETKVGESKTTAEIPWLVPLITLLLGGGVAGGLGKRLASGPVQELIDGIQNLKAAMPEQRELINGVMSQTLSKNSQQVVKQYKSKEWSDSEK